MLHSSILRGYSMRFCCFNSRSRAGSDFHPSRRRHRGDGFNSRSPCGGATLVFSDCGANPGVSTHAPRAGERPRDVRSWLDDARFQLTLPVRGATPRAVRRGTTRGVSTHAPRAGSDWTRTPAHAVRSCFNSRSPCGERPKLNCFRFGIVWFQLTLPVRGATS